MRAKEDDEWDETNESLSAKDKTRTKQKSCRDIAGRKYFFNRPKSDIKSDLYESLKSR